MVQLFSLGMLICVIGPIPNKKHVQKACAIVVAPSECAPTAYDIGSS